MRLKTPEEIRSTLMRDFEIEKTLRRLSGSANYSILDIPQSTKEEVGRHYTIPMSHTALASLKL